MDFCHPLKNECIHTSYVTGAVHIVAENKKTKPPVSEGKKEKQAVLRSYVILSITEVQSLSLRENAPNSPIKQKGEKSAFE